MILHPQSSVQRVASRITERVRSALTSRTRIWPPRPSVRPALRATTRTVVDRMTWKIVSGPALSATTATNLAACRALKEQLLLTTQPLLTTVVGTIPNPVHRSNFFQLFANFCCPLNITSCIFQRAAQWDSSALTKSVLPAL